MPHGRHDARDSGATEPLVSAAEAAALLGVSERTVRRRIAANELPSVKAGRARLIPVSAVTLSPVGDTGDTAVATDRHDTADAETATVLALVDRIGGLERQVGRLESERDGLAARLAVAEERLRALPAGFRSTDDAKPPPAPWWRRWLGRRKGRPAVEAGQVEDGDHQDER